MFGLFSLSRNKKQIRNQVKLWFLQLWMQFLQLHKEAWKIQDFNAVWTSDLAIPVRCFNQLSYEATDVGSWSLVGSNVPVRNESTMKWYMKWIIYELRIWNKVKLWSSQLRTPFLQLCKEARKIQDFNGVWIRYLTIPVRRSNQLSYEATDVGSWSLNLWVLMLPWGMNQWINDIWNGHIRTADMKVKRWSLQLWTQKLPPGHRHPN